MDIKGKLSFAYLSTICLPEKKSTDANDQERDSGSYSDNENDTRKNKRPKEFKERGIQMVRVSYN